jgi:LacI family transcriptional regulator
VKHILSFGHRRIATVAGFTHQFVSQQRLDGFLTALKEQGSEIDSKFIRHGDFRIETARHACADLLALPKRPTALFVANNLMLIGVMQALASAGVSAPRDMSVASIDDFPWASAFQPALTVVRQPIAQMASAALARLVECVNGNDSGPTRQMFEPELIVRKSCAAPPLGA